MTEINLRLENVRWFNGYNFIPGTITITNGRIAAVDATTEEYSPIVCSLTDNDIQTTAIPRTSPNSSLGKSNEPGLSTSTLKTGTTIDCQGKYLIPSFTEAHMHFTTFLKSLGQLDIGAILNLPDLETSISNILKKNSDWLILTNFRANFFEGELPSKDFLDHVSPLNPLMIFSFDLHSCLLNERAVELLLFKDVIRKEDLKAGWIYEQASFNAIEEVNSIGPDNSGKSIEIAIKELNRQGITAIQSYDGGHEHTLLSQFEKNEMFSMRIMTCTKEPDLDTLPKIQKDEFINKWKKKETDHDVSGCNTSHSAFKKLERGPLKLFSDGALGSQTALLSSPYLSSPHNKGIEVLSPNKLKELVLIADKLDLPVSIHAIGDKALDNTLEAFSFLSKERNEYLGNRIEHCQYVRDDHLKQIALSGLSVSTIACHLPYDLKPSLQLLGSKRTKWLHRIYDLDVKRVPFALTSDAPVTRPSPIESIYWACEGRTKLYSKENLKNSQPLTRIAALRATTSTPAAMLYGKDIWGKIAPTMAADLVLLSENPLEIPNVLDLKILFTLFEGKMVYKNEIW